MWYFFIGVMDFSTITNYDTGNRNCSAISNSSIHSNSNSNGNSKLAGFWAACAQAIELALLGGQQWQYAERKAMVALKDYTTAFA